MYRTKDDIIEDSFQAFLVDDAEFTRIQEEYPIIRKDMVATFPPKKIMPFNKALNYRGDLSDTYICFYAPDGTFERIRRNPKRYLNLFSRSAGFIGFDYSVHTDMPLIKQKSQINDNLSFTFYFANNGNQCIPNIRFGIDETSDEFFEAIPKNTLVAIGTHGFMKRKYQKSEWYCLISLVIKKLEPEGIVVVGPMDKKIMEDFSHYCKFYFYESWMEENRKEFYNERRK